MRPACCAPVNALGRWHAALVANLSVLARLISRSERSRKALRKPAARSCSSTLNEVLLAQNLRHVVRASKIAPILRGTLRLVLSGLGTSHFLPFSNSRRIQMREGPPDRRVRVCQRKLGNVSASRDRGLRLRFRARGPRRRI
jgi:hypothetical protein